MFTIESRAALDDSADSACISDVLSAKRDSQQLVNRKTFSPLLSYRDFRAQPLRLLAAVKWPQTGSGSKVQSALVKFLISDREFKTPTFDYNLIDFAPPAVLLIRGMWFIFKFCDNFHSTSAKLCAYFTEEHGYYRLGQHNNEDFA